MRLVLINHYAGSPRHGMEYRPFYLCREWVRSGHTAVIIAASFSHLRIEQPRMDHVPITEEEVQGVHYLWLNTPEYSGNSLGRARNMAAFLAGLLRYGGRWVRRFRPDVVIASSTYPMDIYPARRMARLAGANARDSARRGLCLPPCGPNHIHLAQSSGTPGSTRHGGREVRPYPQRHRPR